MFTCSENVYFFFSISSDSTNEIAMYNTIKQLKWTALNYFNSLIQSFYFRNTFKLNACYMKFKKKCVSYCNNNEDKNHQELSSHFDFDASCYMVHRFSMQYF